MKPGIRHDLPRERHRFPRRNRRGLIEASVPLAVCITRQASVFPGEIAGASLKRLLDLVGARPVRRVFPGEIAGASLKPIARGGGQWGWRAFSPAKSPGPH